MGKTQGHAHGSIGGFPDGETNPLPEAYAYDPATDSWTKLGPMPDWRIAGSAVSLGEHIYVVGGSTKAGGVINNGTVWAYKP